MPKIHILPVHEAQKIAAGEVIERPASVIKELIENALDAGATQITVTVHNGGKTLIRVADNGCGMSSEDAHLCTALHATSKIRSVTELPSLGTFGFRGEALAALAVASRMTITTKQADTHEGIKLTIEHGAVVQTEPVAAHTGTIIEAYDLFYTIPARQKFLKKRETEMRQIQHLFDAIALAHPAVHVTLYSDDLLLARYPESSSFYERCMHILRSTTAHHTLLPIRHEEQHVQLTGVVTDHHHTRYDRTGIHLFVNNRWIKSTHLSRAVMRAYTNVLPPGRFPTVVIMLQVPGDELDVNVHPRKEEVQFMHPGRIEQLVYTSIKNALDARVTSLLGTVPTKVPSLFPPIASVFQPSQIIQSSSFANTSAKALASVEATADKPANLAYGGHVDGHSTQLQAPVRNEQSAFSPACILKEKEETQSVTPIHQTLTTPEGQETIIIGQLLETYILAQTKEGLLLVDQHAAHECILYNRFVHHFDDVATVHLLFPEIIEIAADELETIQPYMDIFYKNGIVLEPFGATQIRVTAMPICNKHTVAEELIRTMIALIHEHTSLAQDALTDLLHKKLRAQMACKAAVKAGDQLDMHQMRTLFEELQQQEHRLTCPHGRPTCWLISQYEIEKKFKRKT
jgi:DNA mismatch repair protein MutL